MTDSYEGGYFSAILNVNQFLEKALAQTNDSKVTRTKKQQEIFIKSVFELLLKDPDERMKFQKYGGRLGFTVNKEGRLVSFIK